MPQGVALVLALLVLAGTLAASMVHSRWPIEARGGGGLRAPARRRRGAEPRDARDAIGDPGPTVGFLRP